MKTAGSAGLSELLYLLRDGQPHTRMELAGLTGLSRSTVSTRIETLTELRLVSPVANAISTGGRPSAQISLDLHSRVVGAVDVGATHVTIALANLRGTILSETTARIEVARGPLEVLGLVVDSLTDLMMNLGRKEQELLGIGIGLPGPVEHSSGRPSNPPIMPGWDDFDVPREVQQRFPVPVLVDNDVNIMALGEWAVRNGTADNLVFLKVATGIGAGIISGGELRRGAQGIAGDIGHIPIPQGAGIDCRCGNTGCLEAVAAAPAIINGLREAGVEVDTTDDVAKLVSEGHLQTIAAVRQAGRDIGDVVGICVSVINPSLIVVGGSLSQVGDLLLAGIREVVYSRSMPLATRHLMIERSTMGSGAGVVGASIMAVEAALSTPRIEAMIASA